MAKPPVRLSLRVTICAVTVAFVLCAVLCWPVGCGNGNSSSPATCAAACDQAAECASCGNCNLGFDPCDICSTGYAESFRSCVAEAADCDAKMDCARTYHNILVGDGSVDASP